MFDPATLKVAATERLAGRTRSGVPADLPAGTRLRRTWAQRLTLLGCALLSVSSLATAGGLAYVSGKASRLQHVTLGAALGPTAVRRPLDRALVAPAAADATAVGGSVTGVAATTGNAPVTILLVGVDRADGLADDDPRRIGRDGGVRSDTMMVARLDPEQGFATVLSLPRDLWLPLGAGNGAAKLNAALPLGGPELLVRTITDNLGIVIDHYVEVDFAQFQHLVDAIGGVPMSFDRPARDDYSGLWIGEAGCRTLDGTTALAFVRSRHLQVLEGGEWVADEASDLSRIDRQQAFLRRAVARMLAKGGRNPVTLDRLVDLGLSSVTVDAALTPGELLALALRLRGLDDERLFTFGLPVDYDESADGQSIVRLRADDAEPVLDILRGVNPDDPAAVRVVLSGADVSAVQQLRAAGFAVVEQGATGLSASADVATAPGSASASAAAPVTTVRYAPGGRYRAELVAAWLEGGAVLAADDLLAPGAVALQVGADFRGVRTTAPVLASHWPDPDAESTEPGRIRATTADESCR